MRAHKEIIAEIEELPDGPKIGAFFDFDGTLMSGFSAVTFLREQIKRGDFSPMEVLELVNSLTSFRSGKIGFSAMMVANTQLLRGQQESDYYEFGEKIYQKYISRLIYPESRSLVNAHLQKGHTVAIVSSATPYQIEAARNDLNIEHLLCTRLEVKDGKFTGEVVRPTCWGEGKFTMAKQLAKKYKVDLKKSYFYSDSDEDLPLLEKVGNPRPLNPNNALLDVARERGWPVRRFGSRGRPRMSDFIRSVAATVSLPVAFAAAMPIWAISGSKRQAQNFTTSIFADLSSALIGMDLVVRGEHNLWRQRPAVFIFNHQSKVDFILVTMLMRRDIAGVGKKELGKTPVIGPIVEFGGTVLIDRSQSSDAIEAMRPLVDVMQNDGKSVSIFPEGTRSSSNKLGRFKKGAFHLAMQAGVPLVPVVIHNAGDIASKGDFIMRSGTVEVDVLDPIDTSDWEPETIDEHVAYVRNLYLETLELTDTAL